MENKELFKNGKPYITKNPFKKGYSKIFWDLANPNPHDGMSKPISMKKCMKAELPPFGNGASWARGDSGLGRYYNVVRHKKGGGSTSVESVQLMGYNQEWFNPKISKEVRDYYKDAPCVMSGTLANIEIDHKDGRKEDNALHDTQTVDDFQPLHKSMNIRKREVCTKCKDSGLRFDAKVLGFNISTSEGDLNYHGTCVGCFWYDPIAFRKGVSK